MYYMADIQGTPPIDILFRFRKSRQIMNIRRSLRLNEDTHTRYLILEIAEELIAKNGIEKWRLQDIANEIGIQVPSIYGYFEGKAGILNAIWDTHISFVSRKYTYDGKEDPKAALLKGANEIITNFIKHPARLVLLMNDFATPVGMKPGSEELPYPDLGPMYKRVEKILADGHKQGIFRKVSLLHFHNTFLGTLALNLLFPTHVVYLSEKSEAEINNIRERVIDVIERLITPD